MNPKLKMLDVKATQTRDGWKLVVAIETELLPSKAYAAWLAGCLSGAIINTGIQPCHVTHNFEDPTR